MKAKMIYFSDLARLYFPKSTPKSAAKQLQRWIQLNHELQKRLDELYYKPYQRALTPLQHQAILDELGEP